MQLLQALTEHETELRGIPKTVDSEAEAVGKLHNGLKVIANQARAATSPHLGSIAKELRSNKVIYFGPQFKALSLKFISQVTRHCFCTQAAVFIQSQALLPVWCLQHVVENVHTCPWFSRHIESMTEFGLLYTSQT